MKRLSYRNAQNLMLFITIFVLGFSFYIEHANQLKACPLCIMQRLCIFLFGFTCILGMNAMSIQRAKMNTNIQCVILGLGLYFAGRQLYLQSLSLEQTGQCLPGLEAMIHYFSLDMILKAFFWGSSDCAAIDWRWFGLSIPAWSALYFVTMFVSSLAVCIRLHRSLKQRSKF
ncbi:MAG TPA: disulfide bond formation protein B [Legionellaceae bacterium]|nr:disulfide bond formation protein B [Legionellaceae bacterium]